MKVFNRIIFFLFIFLLPISIFAGTTGKIVGSVIDVQTSEPLIGANVIIKDTYLGASTDIDGNFIILNVPPGTYTLEVLYIGYQTVELKSVKVSIDLTTTANVIMNETELESTETVVIVAEREMIRKDLTASQSEVSAEDIKALPAEEFEDLLKLQSGVTQDANGGFHIRGGRSSEVAYWVDGVSVTDVFDGSNGVEIENDAVQSLQVISGTFNAEYGQSMSGIINIVTKDGGQKYSGGITAYVGDYFSSDEQIFQNIDDINPSVKEYGGVNLSPDIYDYKFSLGGPVPFLNDLTFFTNFRKSYNDGYLYGKREVNTDGSVGDGEFVSMNFNKWLSSQSKLTYRLNNSIKVRLGFNFEDREFREFDHFYKFNPDGDYKKFQQGYNGSITFDHTWSANTFYTLKAARFEKEFEEYVYENPVDPRYVDSNDPKFSTSSFQFSKGGQKDGRFKRSTRTDILKFDLTSQVSKIHLLKTGLEARRYRLDLLGFTTLDGSQFTEPIDDPYFPVKPSEDDINFGKYEFEPIEFSFYVQDKVEYDDFILNLGIRFDYFDSKGNILADPLDPDRYFPLNPDLEGSSAAELESSWYKSPSAKTTISPRIGLAFPISERGVIHASYGHFSQMPEFRLLYDNPGFRIQRGNSNLMGNADLKPQRTIMYEIGLQQELTSDVGIDITGFYRDVRNWVGTSESQKTYNVSYLYSRYINLDYANVRGLTVSLNKAFSNYFSGTFSYTLQVAEGSASDPNEAYNSAQNNEDPRLTINPLDWDRRQVFNGNIFVGYESWSASLLGKYESGLPYTPNPVQGTQRGASVTSGSSSLADNSGRRPTLFALDLQVNKDFIIAIGETDTRLSLFIKVFNLLDERNEQTVWDDTGRATYTLRAGVSGAGADSRFITRPDFYTQPRRVQFGVTIDF